MRKMKNGFTLIELLVVIAIIAILAAILFPVFSAAKESGRASSCLNNMKQLATGFTLYTGDYNKYPGGCPLYRAPWKNAAGISYSGPEYFMMMPLNSSEKAKYPKYTGYKTDVTRGCLYKYVCNASVYMCPSDTNVKTSPFKVSYSMNAHLDWDFPQSNGSTGIVTSAVRNPSRTAMLIDEGAGSKPLTGPNKDKPQPMGDGYFGDWQDAPAEVHCGGCNFAFCDGHAKLVRHTEYLNVNYDPLR